MRYAGLIKNDVANGRGVCVTLFLQGCPHHCKGCFNPETWDFEGGREVDINDLTYEIIQSITANGVERNFCVMGGEPLAPENRHNTAQIIQAIRTRFPLIYIYVWTGYVFEDLPKNDPDIKSILDDIQVLVDGPFEEDKKDLTLPLRGSSNQRTLYMGIDF